jgi:hypothetical protein
MLSESGAGDGSIQLVDFGCAEVEGEDDDDDDHDIDGLLLLSTGNGGAQRGGGGGGGGDDGGGPRRPGGGTRGVGAGGFTPAYSCPEAFGDRDSPPLPPADMWALGVIVYIMLVGVHPFDPTGRATDEEVEAAVRNPGSPLPLGRGHPRARHLSGSATDLIRRLMERDPRRRMSAQEMLHHPWVTGETASTRVMAGSDKRLDKFRRFKTRLQTQFFADAVGWSDEAIGGGGGGRPGDDGGGGEAAARGRRTSLIERSFKAIGGSEVDAIRKLLASGGGGGGGSGGAATSSIGMLASEGAPMERADGGGGGGGEDGDGVIDMTMSDYNDLLSEDMKHHYFPKGHVVYNEGEHFDQSIHLQPILF